MKFFSAKSIVAALSLAAMSSGAPATTDTDLVARGGGGGGGTIVVNVVLVGGIIVPVTCQSNTCYNFLGTLLGVLLAGGGICQSVQGPAGYTCGFYNAGCGGSGGLIGALLCTI